MFALLARSFSVAARLFSLAVRSILLAVLFVYLSFCQMKLALAAAGPQTIAVYKQGGELWLRTGAGDRQLTDDGEEKDTWAISEDGRRIAYTLRPGEHGRHAYAIAIVDNHGDQIKEIVASAADNRISTVNQVEWIDDARIGIDYQISWAPNKKRVAYVGWVHHFEEQEQPSYYLKINNKTVYPVPIAGESPDRGHHLFLTKFIWSDDSKRVAFVDQVGRHLFLVAAGTVGTPVIEKLPFTGSVRDLSWLDKNSVRVQSSKAAWIYDFDTKILSKTAS
jgi:hypothetical protein